MKVTKGMPEAEYHAIDKASQSSLKMLLPPHGLSPAALRYHMLNPTPPTGAQKIGSALHELLMGEDFAEHYQLGPTKTRNSNAWRDAEAERPEVTLLTGEELDLVVAMWTAVTAHSRANELLTRKGEEELTLEWPHPTGGAACPCKARLDRVVYDPPVIVDVKTTDNCSPDAFQKSIAKWGYHYQAGFYLEAAEQANLDALHYVWIVVEKKPPHQVAVYRFDQHAAYMSYEQLLTPLQTMAECYASGEWPNHPETIKDITLPEWAKLPPRLELL
jgi:hypothetical protein